jgi:succinyl-diaminopimelate desuccinylase
VESWQSDPFEPVIRDGVLYGRGAADMKGSVAAMVVALEAFVARHPDHRGRVALLLTSDEEGPSNLDGVRRVAEHFRATGERIDWCVVGEPSSQEKLGDLIRVGRRGSLSGTLLVRGIQGHVAYPEKARNPIHAFAPALAELAAERWDEGNQDFPPTSFQVSNLNAGTGAPNVIPGELKARFNLRYSPVQTIETLKNTVEAILARHQVNYSLEWYVSGEPFYTPEGPLSDAVCKAVSEVAGKPPKLSTGGGTSDGRFIAALGAQIVELGVINASIHKVNEQVLAADIDGLHRMYVGVLQRLLA